MLPLFFFAMFSRKCFIYKHENNFCSHACRVERCHYCKPCSYAVLAIFHLTSSPLLNLFCCKLRLVASSLTLTEDKLIITVGDLYLKMSVCFTKESCATRVLRGCLHFNLTNKIVNSVFKMVILLINTDQRNCQDMCTYTRRRMK
jgi:hypothetical protein